ncbi:MAG TPA: inorganic diphosphatase [Candidatus Paceibacterota bacterium]|nr:inorganic diphosphatase [Candidatus Paceibacterota bacterium]
MNLWHEIDPGEKDEINVIIEIPKGSKNKYEVDKETGLIALDRVAHTAQDFPFDYGFVPQTLWDDGDPLDVIVLTTYPLFPGILVKVRPVAILNMIDSGDSDAKIIAVPCEDPRFNDIKDLGDINKHQLREIEHFYKTYKNLQNKVVETQGFEGSNEAKAAFEKSLSQYKAKFNK